MEGTTDSPLQDRGELAKLTCPKGVRLLERPRLFAALDQARQKPASWIVAPPGFGKTSLVSTYVNHCGLMSRWYRIDEDDADVANFFYYMHQAGIRHAQGDPGLPVFRSENLPSLAGFARRFFERLYQQLNEPGLLIFDDYQAVAGDSLLHEVLARAVESLPRHLHILFLSRELSPAAFARLHLHGSLRQFDADDLRFTYDETEALAVGKEIRGIDADMIARVNEFTDGWAAGLTLLLERGNLPLPMPLPDTATLQVVFDYFSQEMFCRLEAEVQGLLLQCALFPEMPAEAIQQLTGSKTVICLLDDLCKKNYFTTRHEGLAVIYRFHPLFRVFLLDRASKTIAVSEMTALKKQAACLLGQHGHIEDAVGLLLECKDWQAVVKIILAHAESLTRQRRLKMLASWIQRIPQAVLEEVPWLQFWLGYCQISMNPTKARATLRRAYALFETTQDHAGLYQCWAEIATSYHFSWVTREKAQAWVSVFEQLHTTCPVFPSQAIEIRVMLNLVGLMRLYGLEQDQLCRWLQRCEELLAVIDDCNTRLVMATELAWSYSWLAKNTQGTTLMRESAHLITNETPPLARLNWLLARTIYARHDDDFAGCIEAGLEGLRIADESEVHVLDLYLCTLGTYGALVVGDVAAATALHKHIGKSTPLPQKMDLCSFHHIHALMSLHRGNFAEAAQSVRNAFEHIGSLGVILPPFLNHICLASCSMELGDLAGAKRCFNSAALLMEGIDNQSMTHMYLLGRALLAHKCGHLHEAVSLLCDALNSTNKAGGCYTPLYYRQSLAALYALGLEAGLLVGELQHEVRRQRLLPNSPASTPDNWPWSIRIYTLGHFSLAKDGVPLKTGTKASRKPMQLLKTLIAHGGRNVHQAKLVGELWPDAEGDDAHHAFETTIYRLRKLLGSEAVLVKDGQLTLDPRYCWVDCWAVERVLIEINTAISNKDFTGVARKSGQLLDLYQGPFLDSEHEVPAAISHAECLRSRLLRILDRLGQYWGRCGEHGRTCDCYLRALEVDPRAEVFYQRLMQQYRLLGRHAEAIAVYQRCRHTLHSLLGVAPSVETQSLHSAILSAAEKSTRTVDLS